MAGVFKLGFKRLRKTAQRWWLPGSVAIVCLLILTGLPLAALVFTADTLSLSGVFDSPYYRRVIWFSFYQAFLSASLSVLLAIPVARALSHEPNFPGRNWLINLYSLSLVVPTIVAIFGVVAVYGRTGWINTLTAFFGIAPFSIYGLAGILITHSFFNMPLATRVLLQGLDNLPDEQWRLATQLRMSAWAKFRYLEWPAISSQILGVFMLIFTLCFTSFTIVLTLGGGPRATTVEVAIYQALRFDFDLNTAVTLALLQLLICTSLLILSAFFRHSSISGFQYLKANTQYRPPARHRWFNACIIGFAAMFIMLPLAGLLLSAFNPTLKSVLTHALTLQATVNTILVAITASLFSICMGTALLISTRYLRVRLGFNRSGALLQMLGNIILVMPPVVLGTGLFLLLRPFADVFSLALILAIMINSLMALPFVLRILDGPMMQAAQHNDKIMQSLGIQGLHRWRLIDWPLLRKPLGLAAAVSATLAAGDLSAIALFGSERVTTLPLLLFQRIGSYRLHEAAVTANLLLLVCLVLFVFLQRSIGGASHVKA